MLHRKVYGAIALSLIVVGMCANTVLADDITPIDSLINGASNQSNQTTQTQQPKETQNFYVDGESNVVTDSSKNNQAYDAISQAGKVDINNAQLDGAKAGMQKVASIIVTFLAYLIVLGMSCICMLDLAYIALPPLRKILNPEYNANAGPTAGVNPSGTGGMPGGMGMGMPGGGMGMGMSGMGMGMGSRMGGIGGMGGMGMGMGQNMGPQQTQPQGVMRHQLISNAAINAVNMAGMVDPSTGKNYNPFKIYGKDMLILLVLTPVLIVLATSGTLVTIGFAIGSLLTTVLTSMFGGIL